MNYQRRLFVEEYLQDFNATQAARRAGYKQPHSQGPRLLENVEIQAEIKCKMAAKTMSADEVLLRLGRQARGAIEDFLDIIPGGHRAIINLEKAYKLKSLGLIKKIKVTKGGVEIELYDAQAALVHIGKAHGIFTDKDPGSEDKPFVVKVMQGVKMDDL